METTSPFLPIIPSIGPQIPPSISELALILCDQVIKSSIFYAGCAATFTFFTATTLSGAYLGKKMIEKTNFATQPLFIHLSKVFGALTLNAFLLTGIQLAGYSFAATAPLAAVATFAALVTLITAPLLFEKIQTL